MDDTKTASPTMAPRNGRGARRPDRNTLVVQTQTSEPKAMPGSAYVKDSTALLIVDSYSDFMSEGGKIVFAYAPSERHAEMSLGVISA